MELLKAKDNLTYSVGDVKFFVRASATGRDKLAVDMTGTFDNGKFRADPAAFYEKLIERFVVGWSGVTKDGKDVPYDFQTFIDYFPADRFTGHLFKLGTFIAAETGIFSAKVILSKKRLAEAVEWLLSAGTFTCLRQDCPKDVAPDHPCSRCTMPFVDRDTRSRIDIFNRCRNNGALPEEGGVLDQPESLMSDFDLIDALIAKDRKRKRLAKVNWKRRK